MVTKHLLPYADTDRIHKTIQLNKSRSTNGVNVVGGNHVNALLHAIYIYTFPSLRGRGILHSSPFAIIDSSYLSQNYNTVLYAIQLTFYLITYLMFQEIHLVGYEMINLAVKHLQA